MRLDKYLKLTRLIKRRTVANEACDADRVLVNGKVARASLAVKEGDIIEINLGSRPLRVKVLDPQADVAVNLYSKTLKVGMTPGMVRFLDDNALRYTLM